MGNADLHIHSIHSYDGTATVRATLRQARSCGDLDIIAVTDHDEIHGSLEARELAPEYGIQAIPGMEISTAEGHLLALFVDQLIPARRPLIETLLRIGDLGGIAIVPHPLLPIRNSLSMKSIMTAIAHPRASRVLAGMEVYNMGINVFNASSEKLSQFLPLGKIASSDSHVLSTIGTSRTWFEGTTAEHLRSALQNQTTIAIRAHRRSWVTAYMNWTRLGVLRKFGYGFTNQSPDSPVLLKRINSGD